MARLRKRPKSVPKGKRQDWDNIANHILHLEKQLEELEGKPPRPAGDRIVVLEDPDKAKEAPDA